MFFFRYFTLHTSLLLSIFYVCSGTLALSWIWLLFEVFRINGFFGGGMSDWWMVCYDELWTDECSINVVKIRPFGHLGIGRTIGGRYRSYRGKCCSVLGCELRAAVLKVKGFWIGCSVEFLVWKFENFCFPLLLYFQLVINFRNCWPDYWNQIYCWHFLYFLQVEDDANIFRVHGHKGVCNADNWRNMGVRFLDKSGLLEV